MKIKTIQAKIFIYFFFAATAMIGIYGVIDYNLIKSDMERQMDDRLALTKYMIRDIMEPSDVAHLKYGGKIYIRYVEKFLNMKNITNVNNIFILNRKKDVVLSLVDKNEMFYLSLDSFEIDEAMDGMESASPLYKGVKGKYYKTIYLPLEDNAKTKGIIGIEVSTMYVGLMEHYRNSLFIVGIIIIGIAFLLSLLISRDISNPIKRLQKKAVEIAKRNFDEDIQVSGEEEIKALEDTFNEMKGELKEYITDRDKMATAGEFSAGVAHEMRNSLNVLSGYAELIEERTDDVKLKKYANDILSNAIKMGEFVNNFLTYTKEFLPELKETNMVDFCFEILGELKPEIVRVIKFDSGSEKNITANIDTYLIKKALYNIINNGYQAIEQDKKIIELKLESKDGKVRIHVIDNGKGIKPEMLDKIFQPFFTGKKDGIGLGLAISYRIVKDIHKGEIEVKSERGKGTEFTIII